MNDLNFIPDPNVVDAETITQNKFPTYYEGSEVLMAWKAKPELLGINLVQDRKKRDNALFLAICYFPLTAYTTEPIRRETTVNINTRITLNSDDYKACQIDCLHTENPHFNMEDPTYENISNGTWVPEQFVKRLRANLKIKNLVKISEVSKD